MNLETIKSELKGYFINRFEHNGEKVSDTLCRKISATDYEVLDNVRTPNGLLTAYDHCLNQINNQLLDPKLSVYSLDEVLPVIKSNVFEAHRMRERKIQQHIDLCQTVETEENQLSENRFLVYYKKRGQKIFAIVLDESLTEVPENLIKEENKDKAVFVQYPKLLRTALKDELNNEYESAYQKEAEKFKMI